MSAAPGPPADAPPRAGTSPGERWTEDLLACVHCGFCLPACPTYDVLSDENDSPRGRIVLMRGLAEGRVGRTGAFAEHIDRCLGCRACETACPAGVRYGALLEGARERAGGGLLHRLVDRALLAVTTRRPLATVTYAVGRTLRASGVPGWLASRLPGRAGLAAGMLEATRPAVARPLRGEPRAADSGTARAAAGGTSRPGRRAPDAPVAGTRYALLEGCVMRGLFRHVHAATRRSLRRRGLAERPARGQVCCGALHAHAGRMDAARALARRNIEAFERAAVDLVVVDSAGCGAALKEYAEWLRGDGGWEARARALAAKVRDVTELLEPVGRPGRLPGRVSYDAPCHLLHLQGIATPPLEAMRRVEELRVEPLPSMERCCGGAGIYDLRRPDLAARVLAPKLREIRAGKCDWVATGNPGCLMFVGAGLRRTGDGTPVVHPVELVDFAESMAEDDRPGRRS